MMYWYLEYDDGTKIFLVGQEQYKRFFRMYEAEKEAEYWAKWIRENWKKNVVIKTVTL